MPAATSRPSEKLVDSERWTVRRRLTSLLTVHHSNALATQRINGHFRHRRLGNLRLRPEPGEVVALLRRRRKEPIHLRRGRGLVRLATRLSLVRHDRVAGP